MAVVLIDACITRSNLWRRRQCSHGYGLFFHWLILTAIFLLEHWTTHKHKNMPMPEAVAGVDKDMIIMKLKIVPIMQQVMDYFDKFVIIFLIIC